MSPFSPMIRAASLISRSGAPDAARDRPAQAFTRTGENGENGDIANIDKCHRTETDVLQSSIAAMSPFSHVGRIVERRGPLGPGGAQIYGVLVRRKPEPKYIELRENQLELVPAKG
jgi:hypothetical protein